MRKMRYSAFFKVVKFSILTSVALFLSSCIDGFFKPKVEMPLPEMYESFEEKEESGEFHELKEEYKKHIYYSDQVNVDSLRAAQLEERYKNLIVQEGYQLLL